MLVTDCFSRFARAPQRVVLAVTRDWNQVWKGEGRRGPSSPRRRLMAGFGASADS